MAEAWLSGPVEGVPAPLMPAAHALIDALDELERAASGLSVEELWLRPGGAASVGFHLRHVRGSIDRLLTYARGEGLDTVQLRAIRGEGDPGDPPSTAPDLIAAVREAVSGAIDAYRGADPDDLDAPRRVGRAGLPSTVRGLLFHVADHTRRHAGQVITTAKIIRGLDLAHAARRAPEAG